MLLELNVRLFSVKSYYMYKITTSETEGECMHEKLVCPQVIYNRSFKGGSLVVVRCCMFFFCVRVSMAFNLTFVLY